jgi:MoaA/NifB/PqqE/SkfB family radical SAM enzyme
MRCGHCFYWQKLNHEDDLTMEQLIALSDDLGRIENLYLSGGEPFMREGIAEICSHFIRKNRVEQIYTPTNAYFTKKMVEAIRDILQEESLKLLAIEISLDGTPDYHNRLRGLKGAFEKAMETYQALEEVQRSDQRLRIHAASTITADNVDEVHRLTEMLFEKCPSMDHHNIALIRGDRKNPSLGTPNLAEYRGLVDRVAQVWSTREEGRFGSIVEPMLQWAKQRTAGEGRQVIPCRAGILSGVVYANGDVSFCETLPALGNLRDKNFREIWSSEEAKALRRSIKARDCYCTNEMFLWPSIVFQPSQLLSTFLQSKAWKKSCREIKKSSSSI